MLVTAAEPHDLVFLTKGSDPSLPASNNIVVDLLFRVMEVLPSHRNITPPPNVLSKLEPMLEHLERQAKFLTGRGTSWTLGVGTIQGMLDWVRCKGQVSIEPSSIGRNWNMCSGNSLKGCEVSDASKMELCARLSSLVPSSSGLFFRRAEADARFFPFVPVSLGDVLFPRFVVFLPKLVQSARGKGKRRSTLPVDLPFSSIRLTRFSRSLSRRRIYHQRRHWKGIGLFDPIGAWAAAEPHKKLCREPGF